MAVWGGGNTVVVVILGVCEMGWGGGVESWMEMYILSIFVYVVPIRKGFLYIYSFIKARMILTSLSHLEITSIRNRSFIGLHIFLLLLLLFNENTMTN